MVPPTRPKRRHVLTAVHDRALRWALPAALAFAAALFLFTVSAGTAEASTAPMPREGIFEDCPLDTQMLTCLQRLVTMHQGGIQVVVMSANNTSLTSLATYALGAQVLGMQVMWEISNPGWWEQPLTSTAMSSVFPSFAAACHCEDNEPLLGYLIRWLAALPATYGYYAADDSMLSAGDQPGMATYVSHIKAADPMHTLMIGANDYAQAQQYQGMADLIGTEIYPVTTASLMPASTNQSMWNSVAYTAQSAQQLASSEGRQSAFILQAFTWGDNLSDGETMGVCSPADTTLSCYNQLEYPTAADQLQLRNEVLQHSHPSLILWWSFQGTYGQAGNDTYSIYPTGATAAARWTGLQDAIAAPAPAPAAPIAPIAKIATAHHPKKHHKRAARKRSRHAHMAKHPAR